MRTNQIRGDVKTVQPLEERQRHVRGPALFHRAYEKHARAIRIARLVRRHTSMQQLLALTLPLSLCAPGAFDVRAGAPVPAFEERDSGPDVDGFFVASREIAIETGEEQFLDARLSLGIW